MKRKLSFLLIILFCAFAVKAQTELVSTGSGSAYEIAYPAAFSYSSGITITFKAHAASTAGPVTLNINGLGAKTIKKNVTADLALGDIMLNQYASVIYDGTNFQLTSSVPSSSAGWSFGGNAVTTHTNIGTSSNFDLPFITNGSEKMRLMSSGGLAIGSNNAWGSILNVNGNEVVFQNNTTGIYYTSSNSIGDGFSQQIYDASWGATGSPTMRYIFAPRNNFDTGTSTFAELSFGKIANQNYGYIGFSTRGTDGNYNEKIRIDADGNLAIGLNTPTSKLHVYDNSTTRGGVWIAQKIYGSGTTSTTDGVALEAKAAVYDGGGVGGTFTGVKGIAEYGAVNYGVYGSGSNAVTSSHGVYGEALTASPQNIGVYGIAANGTTNWAGYFAGRGYFSDYLGLGVSNPTAKLHIGGTAGVDGIRFPDGTLQTTAAGASPWTKSGSNVYATTITDNIGVGTTTPQQKIHSIATTDINEIRIESHVGNMNFGSQINLLHSYGAPSGGSNIYANDVIGKVLFSGWNTTTYSVGAEIRATGDGSNWSATNHSTRLSFFTTPVGSITPVENMRIAADGSVGIGTTAPTAKLHLGGTAGVDGIRFPDGTLQTTAAGAGPWTKSGSTIYNTTLADNVGIGTASPSNNLSFGNTANQKIAVENSGGSTPGRNLTIASGSAGGGFNNVDGGNMIIQAGVGTGTGESTISFQNGTTLGNSPTVQTMSTKMTILGNGNVGIGTINPAAKLDVIGTVKITDGTQGVGKILTSDASGNATWLTPAAGGDFMSNGSIAMTGQFLGLSGTAALPGISFSGDADNGLFRPAANQLGISTAGAERVRINASGNVGIGAPSPSTKLDIAGDLGLREINFISPGTTFNAFSTGGFSFVRLVCNFNTVINGFTGGCDGKVLVLYVNNDPGASLTINNQSASALVADRVETVTGANITVGSGLSGVITMIYNQTESRWIVTSVR